MLLTPSDVWGASLRDCEPGIEEGRDLQQSDGATTVGENRFVRHVANSKWQGLDIDVVANGPGKTDVYIDVSLNEEPIEDCRMWLCFLKKAR